MNTPPNLELTPRQKQVLQLLVDGNTFDQIAVHLGICKSTIVKHTIAMRRKYGVATRYEMIAHAVALGDAHVFMGKQS